MTSIYFPKTVTIRGSNGNADYCAITGLPVSEPYVNEDFRLERIDLREYLEYWVLNDHQGVPTEIDVCDIGGWNCHGAYVPAEMDFRAEALCNRSELIQETFDQGDRRFITNLRIIQNGKFEIHVDRMIPDMAPIFDGTEKIAEFSRIDHVYETATAIAELLELPHFTVKV